MAVSLRRAGWLAGVVLVGMLALVAVLLMRGSPVAPSPPPAVSPPVAAAPAPRTVDITPGTDSGLRAAELARITELIDTTPAFRNDVLFLIVAGARDRCQPGDHGVLARMANRAQLPVLDGVSQVTTAAPELDAPIYRYIQAATDAVACAAPFRLAAQPAVDIDAYAQGFPDSFHAPARRGHAPADFRGHPLAQRAAEPCQSVAYAVFPLGLPRWQCDAVRSGARRRILDACEAARDARGMAAGSELSPAFGAALMPAVKGIVDTVPDGCR